MTLAQHVVKVTEEAGEEFFRYALAVPADKLDWKPLETGQSVLSMAREIAMTPIWAYDVTTENKRSEEEGKALFTEAGSLDGIDALHDLFQERLKPWSKMILEFPTEKYAATRWLPFNGGREHTYLEMFEYPRWNCTYHLGQVGYIQRLYGDNEAH